MGCGCGNGGGSSLGNYTVKDKDGKTVKTYTAVQETEVRVFAAKIPGSTYAKTS
jgi:hypothetical protein